MNGLYLHTALRTLGEHLRIAGVVGPIRLELVGGGAGLLGGLLAPQRTTADCDVIAVAPQEQWPEVEAASVVAASALGLPDGWLNRDCRRFAHLLPPGWQERCVMVGRFGPLDVARISRRDLIAMKLVGAPCRPRDLEDIRAMSPTAEDLEFAGANLERLRAESLDPSEDYSDQFRILQALRDTL